MKIAICDDEKVFRDKISEFLQPYKEKNPEFIEYGFSCGEDLLASYEQGNRFDLVFLDVEMLAVSGVEAAKKIRLLDNDVMFIFITGYTNYVSEAFLVNAIQFLIKPVLQEVFNKEVERAICIYKKRRFKYKVTFKNSSSYLEVKDIIYIETYDRHLRVVTVSNIYEYLGNISTEEIKLSEYGFVRCHKGILLNMHYIFKSDKDIFILSNKKVIPISRYLKNEALSKYNRYISSYCI